MVEAEPEFRVLFALFDRDGEATDAVNGLRQMATDGIIELSEAAAVRRDPNLSVRVTDLVAGDPGKGTIVGGVLGLIFSPSVLVGAAVGGAAGGIYGHFRDRGFKNADLEKAGDGLRLGQSALVAVAREQFVDQISNAVRGHTKLDEYVLNVETGAIIAV